MGYYKRLVPSEKTSELCTEARKRAGETVNGDTDLQTCSKAANVAVLM